MKKPTGSSIVSKSRKTNSRIWKRYMRRVRESVRALTGDRKQKGPSLRVALYNRVSIEEQAEGYSIQEQSFANRQFAEQKGWTVIGEYTDEGYSGTNDRRPAFRHLLKDARRQRFDVVIVHKIDRFYRNAQGLLKTHSELSKKDILFISLRENIDFTESWGKVILAVLGILAEIFIDNLREETRKGKLGRARKGLHNGSIPFGYCDGRCSKCAHPNGKDYCPEYAEPDRYRGESLILHPVESAGVKRTYELYATGEYSDGEVADMLNDYVHSLPDGRTIPLRTRGRNYSAKPEDEENTHYRGPGEFTKDTARDILTRPFYAGVAPYYGSHFDGEKVVKNAHPTQLFEQAQHPPIISPALFERCDLVRQARGRRPLGKKKRRRSRIYLLSGLLDCARSGGAMNAQSVGRNKMSRYVCSDRIRHRKPCDQPSVNAEILESQVLGRLLRLCIPHDWHDDILACILDEGGEESLRWQRKQLEESFAEVEAEYETGELSRQAYLRERQAYFRRLRELIPDEHPRVDIAQARCLLNDFPAIWDLATLMEQKQLLQLTLKDAKVDGQKIVDMRWYPPFDQLLGGLE